MAAQNAIAAAETTPPTIILDRRGFEVAAHHKTKAVPASTAGMTGWCGDQLAVLIKKMPRMAKERHDEAIVVTVRLNVELGRIPQDQQCSDSSDDAAG